MRPLRCISVIRVDGGMSKIIMQLETIKSLDKNKPDMIKVPSAFFSIMS